MRLPSKRARQTLYTRMNNQSLLIMTITGSEIYMGPCFEEVWEDFSAKT
jgi:hypothetical protein